MVFILSFSVSVYQIHIFVWCLTMSRPTDLSLGFAKSLSMLKTCLHIHNFLYDSHRFLMVRKIRMGWDESWRKVEIFSVTMIPVRMYTILVQCLF